MEKTPYNKRRRGSKAETSPGKTGRREENCEAWREKNFKTNTGDESVNGQASRNAGNGNKRSKTDSKQQVILTLEEGPGKDERWKRRREAVNQRSIGIQKLTPEEN